MVMSMSYRLENPVHPGGYVRRNVIEPRDLTVMDAASLLDVTRQSLSDFLNEKSDLTAELALRIEAVFGVEMDMLMEMQTQLDIARARKRFPNIRSDLAGMARTHADASQTRPADAEPLTIVRHRHAAA